MLRIRKNSLLTGLSIIVIMTSAPAFTETMMFKAELKGSTEVPPTDSAATGSADVTVDTDTKKLSWTVTSSGLSGDPAAAHFHGPAAPGANAGPVVDISAAIAKGSADITDAQLADLQAGRWYINIHTSKFPDGEIRGQVETLNNGVIPARLYRPIVNARRSGRLTLVSSEARGLPALSGRPKRGSLL